MKNRARETRSHYLRGEHNAKIRERLYALQDGECAICRNKLYEEEKYLKGEVGDPLKNTNLDHDHSTGLTRGVLCTKCNMGLGNFNDDPELLEAAAAYICHWR